jgi:hypothetical protein
MTYLGFDPDRLPRLLGTLDDLADEARRLRSGDPEADGPLGDYQRAVRLLCDFRPRIEAIRISSFVAPVALTAPGLSLDSAFRAWRAVPRFGPRWQFVVDEPLPILVAPNASALALGAWLAKVDLYELCVDKAEFDAFIRLARESIAASGGADAFLHALGADDFGAVVAEAAGIADEHGRVGQPIGARADALVGVLAGALGGIDTLGVAFDDDADQPWLDAVTERSQEGAAWLAATGRLTDDQLSRLALGTFRAFVASGVVRPQLAPDGAYGDLVTSLLAKALTAQPLAGRAFASSLGHDEWLRLVQTTGTDRLGPLLLAVTSQQRFTHVATLPLLADIAQALDRARVEAEDLRPWLGALFGPWLLQFIPLPSGEAPLGSPAVDWLGTRRLDLLRFIARDSRAATDLAVWSQALAVTGVARVLEQFAAPEQALRQVGLQLGEAADVLRDGAIAEAADREHAWDITFGLGADALASALTMALDLAGGVSGFVVSQVLKAVLIHSLDDRLKAMVGIIPADEVAAGELAHARAEHVAFLSGVLEASFVHATASGALPAGSPPPWLPDASDLDAMTLDAFYANVMQWVSAPCPGADARRRVFDEMVMAGEGYLASFSKLAWTAAPATAR